MATAVKTVSTAWAELTSGAAPTGAFRLQNVGPYSVLLRFQTAAPGANELGERLEANAAVETAVLSRVYARLDPNYSGDTTVLVATAG